MKLIDKEKVVEEIERIKKEECPTDTYEGRCKMLWFEQFSSFLDTLETKEVDFEKEWKKCFKYRGDMATVNIIHLAKHFFELGVKQKEEDSIGIKDMDVDELSRKYLLHEHISPLNEIFHKADPKAEMQYHKDIENAYKAGFKEAMKMKN